MTILGHSFERRALVRLAIVAVLCLVAAFGLYYISSQYNEPEVVEPLPMVSAADATLDPADRFADPLNALIARHISASGFDQLKSFFVRGEYQQQGLAALPLRLKGRQPGLYRQVLKLGEVQIVSGYVDGTVWSNNQQIFPTDGDARIAIENRLFVALQSSLTTLGWLDPEEILWTQYELLPEEQWQGRAVAVIRDRSSEMPILHYLDLETALEVRRTTRVVSKDEGEHLVEVIFAEPAEDLACAFPSGYECRLDGKTVNSVRFTQFEFNLWLPDVLFRRQDH